jgi:hypothetical protein
MKIIVSFAPFDDPFLFTSGKHETELENRAPGGGAPAFRGDLGEALWGNDPASAGGGI